ncbi:tyrosine-type recombinase/integrase [Candidatus Methylobacter oryzae]|nr:site-specific integrase [Candidatus Methylobacter oryzae]
MLDDINKTILEQIKTGKKATGVSNATVNRVMSIIRAILNRAKNEWEWIDNVPNVRMLPEPNSRVRWLTAEEAQKLLAELPSHLEAMARFALATGLREANVTGLMWSQIDRGRECAWIHPEQAKAGKAIAVSLNREALEVLDKQRGQHSQYVFSYKGEPVKKAGGKAWRNALSRAGIADFTWHDLRHTWASWHVMNGTPLNVLKELGAWADYDTVLKYAHLSSDRLKRHAGNSKIAPNVTNLLQYKNLA